MEHKTRPHRTSMHYAQLMKRNKVIAFARNAIGSRSRGCGYNDVTIHAECAVIKKLGDVSKLAGCTLVVWRVNLNGDLMPSKPCSRCQVLLDKCTREYGLRKVVYS